MSSYTLYIQRRFHTSTTLVIIPYSRFASVKYPILGHTAEHQIHHMGV